MNYKTSGRETIMPGSELEQYKHHVSTRLRRIVPLLQKYALGDFSESLEIPKKEDEFTELFVGLSLMMDDIKELINTEADRTTRLTVRVDKINETICKVARGDYSSQVEVTEQNDELDSLAMGVNMMIDDVRNTVEEIEILQKEQLQKAQRLEKTVTKLEVTRREILKEKEKYRTLIENASEAIIVVQDGVIKFANPKGKELYGYSQEELVSRPHTDFIHKKDREMVGERLGRRLKGKKLPASYSFRIVSKTGDTKWAELRVSPYSWDGKSAILCFMTDITERRQVETALKISEERFRILFDFAPDAMYISDLKGTFIEGNKAAEKMLDYNKEELIGKSFLKLHILDKTQIPRALKLMAQNILGKPTGPDEFILQRKDGRKVTAEILTYPVKIKGETRVLGIARDITERKKVEETLEERMKELQCLYSITKISERQGITLEELCKEVVNMVPPSWQYPEITCCHIRIEGKNYQTDNFRKTKWKQEAEIRVGTQTIGSIEIYYLEKKPDIYEGPFLKGERDLISAIAIRLGEFTTQKRLQNEIIESEELLNSITTSAQDGIIVIDHDGNVIFWNDSAETIFGYSAEEIIGKNFHDTIAPEKYQQSYRKGYNEFRKTGTGAVVGKTLELSALSKDGKEFPVELSLSATKINNNWHGVGIIRDITERKEIEGQLEEAKTQAEQANRAKSEFLANMSHEIRTPMNAILGFAEILEDQLATTPEYHDYVTGIRNSGKGLLGLINDILDLSKIEAGKLEINYEPINSYTIIDEIRQIYSLKTKEKKLNFEINVDPELPKGLLFDETRLRQILFNLIGNAIKFTSEGGITVNVKSKDGYEEGSHIDLFIEVIDTGIGICEKSQQIIFEPFRQKEGQSTRRYGGTGLGLTITKRLVNLMNGTISLKSEVDKGSTFEIFLPHIQVSALVESTASEAENVSGIEFKNPQILLVEDVESNRKVVRGYLESCNVRIIEAENGSIGIEKAEKFMPDLILMDMQMPGMDGYEATGIIKAEKEMKNIPIVALTSSTMEKDVSKIENLCDGYLRKPVTKSRLLSELIKFLPYTKLEEPEEKIVQQKTDYLHELKQLALQKNRIPKELVDIFRTRIIPEHENIMKNRSNKKIRNFAAMVLETGKEYNIEVLEDYGKKLHEYIDSFNVKNINALLADFNEMTEIIS